MENQRAPPLDSRKAGGREEALPDGKRTSARRRSSFSLDAQRRRAPRIQRSRRPLPKAKRPFPAFLLRKGPKISKSERAPAKKRSLGKLRLGLFLLLALLKLLHSMLPATHVIIHGDGHRP